MRKAEMSSKSCRKVTEVPEYKNFGNLLAPEKLPAMENHNIKNI